MSKDLIRYDLLVQDALKGVVRKVLGDAARDGLLGDHHFYISFRTDFPGARVSSRLREKYPQEMTIVLQHQFWDLSVTEHAFEVGLSFSGIPERLVVPFDAITGFFDPSVQFGLKFETGGAEPASSSEAGEASTQQEPKASAVPAPAPAPGIPAKLPLDSARPAAAKGGKPDKAPPPAKKAADADEDAPPAAGAEVVSLDAFRKKN